MGFWPVVKNVLKNSDVVVLTADARLPELTQNRELVAKAEQMGKKLLIAFNKIDLIPKENLDELKKQNPEAFFVSGKSKVGVRKLKKALDEFSENFHKPSTRVSFVGYPNTGKSTIINIIAPKARAKVSHVSGTTKKTQWTRIGRLRIMDSPGVIPSGDSKSTVAIVSAKDPHRIKDPEKSAMRIINFLKKNSPESINEYFGVSTEGKTDYEIFEDIAMKKGFLIKGGEVDENRTAIKIIDDWQKGKVGLK